MQVNHLFPGVLTSRRTPACSATLVLASPFLRQRALLLKEKRGNLSHPRCLEPVVGRRIGSGEGNEKEIRKK